MKKFILIFSLLSSLSAVAQQIFTQAPKIPVRSMAEWEESQAIMIAWKDTQRAILKEIVRYAKLEGKVIIFCNSANLVSTVKTYLTANNISVDENIIFQITTTDTIWIRDYGANSVYYNDVDSLALVDWRYNRKDRKSDDISSFAIAELLKKSIFQTLTGNEDLINTGGNFMSDGLGTAFASKLILEENSGVSSSVSPLATKKSEAKIDSIMYEYMGINRYIKMETLPFDGIHHIDMHMKLLDEETLIVGEYPKGIADGPQIEANIQYVLNNYKTPFGNDYDVIRIPMPPDGSGKYPNTGGQYRTYANALIVNKTVLVPTYDLKYDSTALKIWKKALRGHNIVGINCNNIIGQNGAIHCITKEIGVDEPLWITHSKVKEYVWGNPFNSKPKISFKAKIKHRSGISEAKIYYKTKIDTIWRSIAMLPTLSENIWEAELLETAFKPADTLFYYIAAEAQNGKKITRPITGASGAYPIKIHYWVNSDEAENYADIKFAKIYPNPAQAITCIEIESNVNTDATINIFDLNGRLIENIYNGTIPDGNSKYFFDANNLISGVYIVQFSVGSLKKSEKIIIAK